MSELQGLAPVPIKKYSKLRDQAYLYVQEHRNCEQLKMMMNATVLAKHREDLMTVSEIKECVKHATFGQVNEQKDERVCDLSEAPL